MATKALTISRGNQTTTLFILAAAVLLYFLLKSKPAAGEPTQQYQNTKEWEITYNSDGMPVRIVKHVNAKVT